MGNPPAFKTDLDLPVALEAQKRAFERWRSGGPGKAVMFFPTFTNPKDVPPAPACAIAVGSLDREPGLFWVHNRDQAQAVHEAMKDGSWPRLIGVVDPLTEDNLDQFKWVVAAVDPVTEQEWTSYAVKDHPGSIVFQIWIVMDQFPEAEIRIIPPLHYRRK